MSEKTWKQSLITRLFLQFSSPFPQLICFGLSYINFLKPAQADTLTIEKWSQNVINNLLIDWIFTKRLLSFTKHWLYYTLKAELQWYRYEYQVWGSIDRHGTAKLKTELGLCALTEITLKGYLAAKNLVDNPGNPKILHDIVEGSKACAIICDYGVIAFN